MCKDHKNSRSVSGLSKDNENAHQQDHKQWSRRDFVKSLGLTTSLGMIMGSLPVRAFTSVGNNFTGDTDNILVMIRLVGGNDGLNTIVPIYDYGRYLNLRPSIAHQQSSLLNLSDEFAIPQSASSFMEMWNSDKMKVIHGAGYPDQNLSHFRSTDIWATAEPEEEIMEGWLGELITLDDPDIATDPPEHPAAVQIGNNGNLTFNNGDNVNLSFQVSNTDQLFQVAENGSYFPLENLPDCLHGEQVEYARKVANSTFRYAEVIQQSYESASNSVAYTESSLANQLAIVARLIKGGLRSSFYMVNLNGFDTHANQSNIHNQLLNYLSSNVKEFYDDLASANVQDRVLTMTSSEFGRRPQQNSSGGTDHGAAAPLLLFGPAVEGSGFVGTHPDLDDLDAAGNLKFSNDFRSIYSSIMVNWLCFPEDTMEQVLGQPFNPLDLGFSCSTTRTVTTLNEVDQIKKFTHTTQDYTFRLALNTPLHCSVQVFNSNGKLITSFHDGLLSKGIHDYKFRAADYTIAPGMYYFVVRGRNGVKSEKFSIM